MSLLTFGYIGNSGETSRSQVHVPDLTAANFDTVTGEGAAENVGEIKSALDAITLMNNTQRSIQVITGIDAASLPASAFAQREIKLFVQYVDDVTAKKYSFTVPGPDLSLIAQTGTDVVDHTSNAFAAALVTALETYAVSPDQNAISVTGMRIVGRNV